MVTENSPKKIREGVWVFPPNHSTKGGASWWLGCQPEPVLIDCPPLNSATLDALKRLSAGRKAIILLTNREGHGRVRALQELLDWPVLLQEQEAYLLPGLKVVESFAEEHTTSSGVRLLWTPGPTPGSCVAYAPEPWNVLFCGRLLIPVAFDRLDSLPNRRTFHWLRQQNSLKKMRQWIPPEARPSLASGAGLGMLGGQKLLAWEAWGAAYTSNDQMIH